MKTYTIKAKWVDSTGHISKVQYPADGAMALIFYHGQGEDCLTVNLSAYGLTPPEGHVYIKTYAEHEGLPEALVEAGVAEKVQEVKFGYGSAWLMKVLI